MSRTIDITPTWGEIGLMLFRFAVSKEVKAFAAARTEYAKAFAAAQALQDIQKSLTPEQQAIVNATFAVEYEKVMR